VGMLLLGCEKKKKKQICFIHSLFSDSFFPQNQITSLTLFPELDSEKRRKSMIRFL
jgi:hypothetical protein